MPVDANAQAPQDVANMAAAQPTPAPTIVNPVDSFFDDYKMAVEADKARRPKARPREPVQAPPPPRDIPRENGFKGKYARFAPSAGPEETEISMTPEDIQDQEAMRMRAGIPEYLRSKEFKPADRPIGRAMDVLPGAVRREQAKAAPHVDAFSKAVAPKVELPSFIKAEKKPINPKLDSVLASMDGGRLETMGAEFASTYFKDAGASGYKDEELQQVYLGVQEHLRDRVKKGYKLKTMDEARLFEED